MDLQRDARRHGVEGVRVGGAGELLVVVLDVVERRRGRHEAVDAVVRVARVARHRHRHALVALPGNTRTHAPSTHARTRRQHTHARAVSTRMTCSSVRAHYELGMRNVHARLVRVCTRASSICKVVTRIFLQKSTIRPTHGRPQGGGARGSTCPPGI